ncbi:MAG: tetratricopeptide repeat protein [Sulfuricaulis sp.]|uniref:tetratricopeptide repeat protein n=1 Tax=Sulfuricaulis sp. TaxID=2003553 RepID=UPI0034A48911
MSKLFLAVVLTLTLVPTAMAAGSSSTSRPPSPPRAQPSDYDLGVKAVQAGDYQRALALLQRVVQAQPRNADAWNYVGFSHRKLRQFELSLAAYQKALAINPGHRGANEYLGELYLMTGEPEKAQAQLAKLQSVCPGGCAEYDDLKKAIEAYRSAKKKG